MSKTLVKKIKNCLEKKQTEHKNSVIFFKKKRNNNQKEDFFQEFFQTTRSEKAYKFFEK